MIEMQEGGEDEQMEMGEYGFEEGEQEICEEMEEGEGMEEDCGSQLGEVEGESGQE